MRMLQHQVHELCIARSPTSPQCRHRRHRHRHVHAQPEYLRGEMRGIVLPNVARDERRHVLLQPERVRLEHATVSDQRAAIVHEHPKRQPVLRWEGGRRCECVQTRPPIHTIL